MMGFFFAFICHLPLAGGEHLLLFIELRVKFGNSKGLRKSFNSSLEKNGKKVQ